MFLTTAAGWRAGFRDWRRGRPFWAGLWTLLAGVEILSIPLAPLALMMHEGVAGVSGTLMGAFMVVLGLSLWVAPGHRAFAGIATLVFAVSSLVLSNFGGFLVGFLLGALGGAMAVSWAPDRPVRPGPAPGPGPRWPTTGTGGPGGPDAGGPGPAGAGPVPSGAESGGAGAGGGGDSGAGPGGPGGARRRANCSARGTGGNRLRALGALPAGGALLAGMQPAAPAAAHAGPVDRPPTVPADTGDPQGGGGPTLCSLLDALLATAAPTARVDGHGGPARHPARPDGGTRQLAGLHARVDAPLGLHASVGAALPGRPSTDPPGSGPTGGGLLGAVTGLLGLDGPSGGGDPRPGPSVPGPRVPYRARAAGRPPGARPTPRSTVPGGPPGALLRLGIPALPADHALDGVLSSLPPVLHLGGSTASGPAGSPWCLPRISLGLTPGAARYGGRAASQPFRVRTPLLVLTGLTYRGITDVATADGPRRVLAFTASRVDIAALRQTAALLVPGCGPAPGGYPRFTGLPGLGLPLLDMGLPGIGRIDPDTPDWAPCQGESETDGAPDATTTATGEPVVLLTTVLSGDLLGLLPVTFTPDMPPPLPPGLTVPLPLFLTDVTSDQQYLGADELTVPGLRQTTRRP